jgi:hypothetical protein
MQGVTERVKPGKVTVCPDPGQGTDFSLTGSYNVA